MTTKSVQYSKEIINFEIYNINHEGKVKIMKKSIKKLITLTITTAILISNTIVTAKAEWRNDSVGWWNTEGTSYSVGWKEIGAKWYYFGQDGYMKTGWLKDMNEKYYYLQNDGSMATNMATTDGYWVDDKGVWIQPTTPIVSSTAQNNNKVVNQNTISNTQLTTTKPSDYISVFYQLADNKITAVSAGKQSLNFYGIETKEPEKTYGMILIKKSDYGIVGGTKSQDISKIMKNYKIEDNKLVEK